MRIGSRKVAAADDMEAAALAGLEWLVNAPKFEQVDMGEDGRMTYLPTVDPRVFAVHKWWVSQQNSGSAHAPGRRRSGACRGAGRQDLPRTAVRRQGTDRGPPQPDRGRPAAAGGGVIIHSALASTVDGGEPVLIQMESPGPAGQTLFVSLDGRSGLVRAARRHHGWQDRVTALHVSSIPRDSLLQHVVRASP